MRIDTDQIRKIIRTNEQVSVVVFAVILFLIFLLIFLRILSREISVVSPDVPFSSEKIEINFEILENPIFDELNNFEDVDVPQDVLGRENPFIPY